MTGKGAQNRWHAVAVLLLVCVISGCEGARIVGTWKGTFDGEDHELEFTGMGQNSGRMYRSTDLLGKPGWTSWKVTRDQGKKQWITAGGHKLIVTFKGSDEILIFDEGNQNRVEMQRIGGGKVEEEDSKSYATAYLLLVLAIAFGLVAICRPSRREKA
jgi:hypothetical protein